MSFSIGDIRASLGGYERVFKLGAAIFLFAFTVWLWTQYKQLRKLAAFRGPWLAKVSDAWLVRAAASGEMHLRLYEMQKLFKDDSLVRIGPNKILTNNPKICSHMSSVKQNHRKGQWYAPLKVDPFRDNIFSERSPQKHDVLRKQMIKAFSTKDNAKLHAKIDTAVAGLVDLIERKYLSSSGRTRRCDFAEKAGFFSMDVITNIAFGKPFGDCADDEDKYSYMQVVASILPLITLCTSSYNLLRIVDSDIFKLLAGPSEKDAKGQGPLMKLAREMVETRTKTTDSNEIDMLGNFLREGMSPAQAQSEILTQVLAGSDTTATTVRSAWLHVISNPRVYARLRSEIDDAIAAGRVSQPVTDKETLDLPYLQAVVRESMRIWPPFTGLLIKLTHPEGESIDGVWVPGDTEIAQGTWSLMRHHVFGDDVEVFRPERFLEADDDTAAEMDRVVGLVFGSGRWLCLGKQIVFIELRKVLVELMRRFDCQLVNQAKPWDSVTYTLHFQKNLWCRFERRQDAVASLLQ